ncbi:MULTISPECIES: DUF2594 family protein [unclassified Tatumella]|uniref:DUF2594 family protein n=1 Tax=unclassified Tatumella TaxID=2649542 RepID=UPI001BAFFBD5|nr:MULTISPECIES: DUF2594 family protein [unclassified Tatumella]MBS0878162.1 DUF2594 family protein [Tatumella sp. JGM82]MBS0889864.1 DUF2594 family protein [Tatumella sp. JGM94]MBS0892445.1 DUF2594 family protein [Tatumella sp. JGM130]MBS0902875.1 DUF2594 family protein [Tatumella sp. JGM100]
MNYVEFPTEKNPEALSREVTCLKMMITCILQSMSQVDAGKAILNMERYLASLDADADTELFITTLKQIKAGYLQ